MIAVLDTNLIVSGLLSPGGAPSEILDAWRDSLFHIALCPPILSEIEQVLNYPRLKTRHRLSKRQVKALLAAMENLSILVPGRLGVEAVKEDPSDNMFISCAVEAGASYIVSGDHHLLSLKSHEGIEILSPKGFLAILHQK